MAKIYVKSTTLGDEKCLILNGREGVVYPIPFKNATRIKVGMYYSIVPTADDNATIASAAFSETLGVNTPRDKFYFGLKKSQSLDMPTENGEYFWGARSNILNAASSRFDNYDYLTEYPRRATVFTTTNCGFTSNASVTSNYASYMGIEFIIGPDALAADNVKSVQMGNRNASSINNVSGSALRAETLNNSFASVNGGFFGQVNSTDSPASVFVYWPFFNTRLRIHSIAAYQVA